MSRGVSRLTFGPLLFLILFSVACSPAPKSASVQPSRAKEAAAALPGVLSGDVVYQALDGSVHAIRPDRTNDRWLAAAPDSPDKSQTGWIAAWSPSLHMVVCVYSGSPADESVYGYPDVIYLYDLVTRRITPIPGDVAFLSQQHDDRSGDIHFSSDGKKLLYPTSWYGGNGPQSYFIADVASGKAREVREASWDSVARPGDGPMRLDLGPSVDDGDYLVVDDETKKVTHLRLGDYVIRRSSFSPDGRYLLFEAIDTYSERGDRPGETKVTACGVERPISTVRMTAIDATSPPSVVASGSAPTFWNGQ